MASFWPHLFWVPCPTDLTPARAKLLGFLGRFVPFSAPEWTPTLWGLIVRTLGPCRPTPPMPTPTWFIIDHRARAPRQGLLGAMMGFIIGPRHGRSIRSHSRLFFCGIPIWPTCCTAICKPSESLPLAHKPFSWRVTPSGDGLALVNPKAGASGVVAFSVYAPCAGGQLKLGALHHFADSRWRAGRRWRCMVLVAAGF
jgi:hypothetical protein